MKKISLFLLACSVAVLAVGADTPHPPATPPLLVLVSMDAFRWDYCALHPAETPHLRQLMRAGISARGLISVFPSDTFPNHYSIVTGLYPSHHGIINNDFFDPQVGRYFHYTDPADVQASRWWKGEPIWATAVKQGRKSAVSFWVGSEAEIGGVRPTFWRVYDPKRPFAQRLAEFDGWLRLPADRRPAVIAFYLEETNSVGHKFGPDSPELAAAIKLLDGRVGQLEDRLKANSIAANLVIVSDHGMTPISPDRVILLDDYLNPASVLVDFDGSVAGLRPAAGGADAILRALAPLQHARAYRTADLPARFHVSPNPRNPAVWIVPDEGWEIYFRSHFDSVREKFSQADHGYDPAFTAMHGILIAAGPSFKGGGTVIGDVENIHIYNMLCAALGLTPAPNDGDDRLVRAMLK